MFAKSFKILKKMFEILRQFVLWSRLNFILWSSDTKDVKCFDLHLDYASIAAECVFPTVYFHSYNMMQSLFDFFYVVLHQLKIFQNQQLMNQGLVLWGQLDSQTWKNPTWLKILRSKLHGYVVQTSALQLYKNNNIKF